MTCPGPSWLSAGPRAGRSAKFARPLQA